MSSCKICGNSQNNKTFKVLEMMHGTRDQFYYLECDACGCVQLMNPPEDMSSYYSNDHYGSFGRSKHSILKKILRNYRNKYAIFGEGGLPGRFLNNRNPLPSDYCLIKDYATRQSKILDVGCGQGAYMVDLKNIGFDHVSGIDPFLEQTISHSNGVVIKRKSFGEISEKYDVIVSHHSFEHVADPLSTLRSIKNNLENGGVVLLTVPVAEALYRKYQQSCYLIQAPQHFFLPSIKSMKILTQQAGLSVSKVIRDSENALVWCQNSELWEKDIAVNEMRQPIASYFGDREITEMKQFILDLERSHEGDNATFVLTLDQ